MHRHSWVLWLWLRFDGFNTDAAPTRHATARVLYTAIDEGPERVISTHADIYSRVILRAALPD